MLSHAPEEPPLVTLLRKTMTRLRERTPRAEADTPTTEATATAKRALPVGVPLVLPFDRERRLIPRLLRKLRRGRFLRYRPDTLNEYAPLNPYAANYYLERLRNADIDSWRECVVSIWALGRLAASDPERVETEKHLYRLLRTQGANGAYNADLADDIDYKRVCKRWRSVLRVLFWLGILGWAKVMLRGSNLPADDLLLPIIPIYALGYAFVLSFPATVLTFVGGVPLDRQHRNRMRAMALLTLGRWREPRHLDLLLREYVGNRGRVSNAAEIALREVLPLLEVEEETEKGADFVPNLCRALQRKERQMLDYSFQEETIEVLLLEALGKVGDGRALPTVERIARRGRTPQVKALAQSILPILHTRSRRANDPNQLLRSAGQPEAEPNTLLRPAHNTQTPANQLLRPLTTSAESSPVFIQRNDV